MPKSIFITLLMLAAAGAMAWTWQFSKEDKSISVATVTITSESALPVRTDDMRMLGNAEGPDFVIVSVVGTVKNFAWTEVSFDDELLSTGSFIERIPQLSDQTIVIGTSIPEGVPNEMLVWESNSGVQYSFVISYDGLTGSIRKEFKLK